jgi:hypothetical protein
MTGEILDWFWSNFVSEAFYHLFYLIYPTYNTVSEVQISRIDNLEATEDGICQNYRAAYTLIFFVSLKNTMLWDVTSCSPVEVYWRFGRL